MSALDDFTLSNGEPNYDAARQQVALLTCLYSNLQSSAEAIARIDGALTEVLLWEFRRDGPRPSRAIFRQGRRYFIFVEGTIGRRQWGGNFSGIGGRLYIDGQSVVHTFFEDCSDELVEALQVHLPETITDEEIFLSGHSLGGAVAFLTGLNIAQRGLGNRVQVLTFGEPRSLTDGYTGQQVRAHWRFGARGDSFCVAPPRVMAVINQSKEDRADQNYQRLRYWGRYFFKRFNVVNWAGIDRLWTHYGTLVYLSDIGPARNTGRAEPDVALFDSTVMIGTTPWDNHSVSNYAHLLEVERSRNPGSPSMRQVYQIAQDAFAGRLPPDPTVVPNFPAYIRLPGINELLAPVDPPEIDETNVLTTALRSLTSTGVEVANRSNIHESETLMITEKTVWKMTFFVTDSELGKSHTLYWNGGVSTILQARDKAVNLINKRRNMLGNAQTQSSSTVNNLPDKGCPVYTHVRISDAAKPRYGQLFRLPFDTSHGWGTDTGNTIADFFSVGLGISLVAESSVGGPRVRHTETFVGQQDALVSGGQLILTAPVGYAPNNTFEGVMNDYLSYITLPGSNLGCVGQDPALEKKLFTAWRPDADLFATATCAGHGYATNDLVRVTESKVSGFNGVYRVKVVDANTVTLLGKVVTAGTVPLTARLRLKETAAGVRQIVFYQFIRPPAGFDIISDVRVVKRNIAQKFSTVSFPKKGKRR